LGGDAGQVIAGELHHLPVDPAGRGKGLESSLDIDGKTYRTPCVRLERLTKSAILVLIAAQSVDHPTRRRAQKTGSEQPSC